MVLPDTAPESIYLSALIRQWPKCLMRLPGSVLAFFLSGSWSMTETIKVSCSEITRLLLYILQGVGAFTLLTLAIDSPQGSMKNVLCNKFIKQSVKRQSL